MRLLELLREYADACETEEKALAGLGSSWLFGEATDEGPSIEARARHARAERAVELVRAHFEDELNDLVDRRVQKALDEERQKAGEGW